MAASSTASTSIVAHDALVPRARPAVARRARRHLAHHLVLARERAVARGVRGSEEGDDGCPDRTGEVKRSGVGGDDDPRTARELDVVEERRLERTARPPPGRRDDAVGESLLAGPPRHERREAERVQPLRELAEAVGRPQLARPAAAGVEHRDRVGDPGEAAVDAGHRVDLVGQRELARADGLDAERAEELEVLVDHVAGVVAAEGLVEEHRGGRLASEVAAPAHRAPRPGEPRPRRRLPQALEVEGGVVAAAAQRAHRAEGAAPRERPARRRGHDVGQRGVVLEQRPRRGLDEPARLPAVPLQRGEDGQRVHDVADRRQPHDERLHARILAISVRVSWSFASPTMATRPP